MSFKSVIKAGSRIEVRGLYTVYAHQYIEDIAWQMKDVFVAGVSFFASALTWSINLGWDARGGGVFLWVASYQIALIPVAGIGLFDMNYAVMYEHDSGT